MKRFDNKNHYYQGIAFDMCYKIEEIIHKNPTIISDFPHGFTRKPKEVNLIEWFEYELLKMVGDDGDIGGRGSGHETFHVSLVVLKSERVAILRKIKSFFDYIGVTKYVTFFDCLNTEPMVFDGTPNNHWVDLVDLESNLKQYM